MNTDELKKKLLRKESSEHIRPFANVMAGLVGGLTLISIFQIPFLKETKKVIPELWKHPYYIAFEVFAVLLFIFILWRINHPKLTRTERAVLHEMMGGPIDHSVKPVEKKPHPQLTKNQKLAYKILNIAFLIALIWAIFFSDRYG